MDKVVHFEIPVEDVDRAKKFYSIFGWQMEDMPGMDYTAIRTVEVDDKNQPTKKGAINGGMMKRDAQVKAPTIAIDVESVDTYVKKVQEMGGTVVKPKTQVGEMGYYCYVTDTEGNVVGLWEEMAHSMKKEHSGSLANE